jgi:hypothetical protein
VSSCDNTAWRGLVADVVRRGTERGAFSGRYDAGKVAVHDAMATIRDLLRN